MGNNFIYNGVVSSTGTGLPGTKIDVSNPPILPGNQSIHGPEFNAVTGALADVKTAILVETSILNYGADATGGTDSHAAFVAAIAALSSGGILHLPAGNYRISQNTAIPANITLAFDSSTIIIDNTIVLTISGTIRAAAAQIFSFGGSPTSSYYPIILGAVPQTLNVKWFGAVGDGVTDDSGAFRQAFFASHRQAQALASLPGVGEPFTALPMCVVHAPAGKYLIGSTFEIASGSALHGEQGRTTLQASSAISILRTAASFVDIKGITFVGGLNAILMYGPSLFGGFNNPTASGNAPFTIDHVVLNNQTGPSIKQDVGPIHLVNGSPPTLPLAGGTITVQTSTSDMPASGTLSLDSSNGPQAIAYTGISGNTFTGCTGGTGTVSAGAFVSFANFNRTFQSVMRVSNFDFYGPCLFWGSGDLVSFEHGHCAPDFTLSPTSADGFPLGVWNSGDTLTLINIHCSFSGTQGARACIIVGTGKVSLISCSFGQNDEMCLVRQRIAGNSYLNARIINYQNVSSGSAPLVLNLDDCALTSVFGNFWLECYEALPAEVKLRSIHDPDFLGALGIWLDQSTVALPYGTGLDLFVMDFDRSPDPGSGGSHSTLTAIWQGFDPGSSAKPTQDNSHEVTDAFVPYLERVYLDTSYVSTQPGEENLIALGQTDNTAVMTGAGAGWILGAVDTSTGISLTSRSGFNTSSPSWNLLLSDGSIGFSSAVASAGVYCFSIYLKVNYPCWINFVVGPNGSIATTAARRLQASDSFQRVEVPFYYPGGAATLLINTLCNVMAQAVIAWPANTALAVGNLSVLGGHIYQVIAVVGDAKTALAGGPTGTGPNPVTDNHVTWIYVGEGGTFTPSTNAGLWMINKGYRAAPYQFPQNNDGAAVVGYVPRNYYGTAAPTAGRYFVGDICANTAPTAGGYVGWICTTGGTPGTWRAFGPISLL